MINFSFGGKDDDKEDESNPKLENPSNPEFWENLGIKPILIDPNSATSIEEMGKEIFERISAVAEELKEKEE